MKIDYQLYLVTEESVPTEELVTIVEEAIRGGATVVQLREKRNSGKTFFEKAQRLKELTEKYSVPLIINDRVDVALAVKADGVHIGQKDLPLTEVRKIVPSSMLVGVSCRTLDEAMAAEKDGANYIGVGAVFPTSTKNDAKVLADGVLAEIINTVSIPVVAIGGITLENVAKISGLGISGVAVVSEIMKADRPFEAAKKLREKLGL